MPRNVKLRFFRTRQGKFSQRGAALVEYAFIMIIFLTLIFGVGGFSHALFVYHYLNEVAKSASRYAIVRGIKCTDDGSCVAANSATGTAGATTQADIQAYVVSITPQSIDSSKVIATVTWPGPSSPPICSGNVTLPNGTVVNQLPLKSPGCTVAVNLAYPYQFIFPFLTGTTSTTAPCTSAGLCLSTTSEMIIAH